MVAYKFGYDPSGKNRANAVYDEFHDVGRYFKYPRRPFSLDAGYFYDDSLVVRDSAGRTLVRNVDYTTGYLHGDGTVETGQSIVGLVIIINKAVSSRVYVDAQMVGGDYCSLGGLVNKLQQSLINDKRNVDYYNLADKPSSFNVVRHKHHMATTFGWNPFAEVFIAMRDAIRQNNRLALEAEVKDIFSGAGPEAADLLNKLVDQHIADESNPHVDTIEKMGFPQYRNRYFIRASEVYSTNQYRDHYITAMAIDTYVNSYGFDVLRPHIAAAKDPHETTLDQLGMDDKYGVDILLRKYASPSDTAENAMTVYGYDRFALIKYLRDDLRADALVGNPLAPALLGKGNPSIDTLLFGDGVWRDPKDIIAKYTPVEPTVVYAGLLGGAVRDEAFNKLVELYSDKSSYPVGSLIIYSERLDVRNIVGDRLYSTDGIVNTGAIRTENGWDRIDLIDHKTYHNVNDPFFDVTK